MPTLLLVLMLLATAPAAQAGVHRWTAVGPEAGQVRQVVAVTAVPNTFWAVVNHRPYRSTDGGSHWTERSAGLPAQVDVDGILVEQSQPGTLLAALFGVGLYRTADDGASWTRVLDVPVLGSQSLGEDPTAPGTLYVGSYNTRKILRSTDHGASWSVTGTVPSPGTFDSLPEFAVDPHGAGTLYGVRYHLGDTAFVVSTDGGATWTERGAGLRSPFGSLFVTPTLPTTLWLRDPNGLQRSTDGGVSWSQSGLGQTNLRLIAVDPSDPTVLFGVELPFFQSTRVLRSADGGAAWTPIPVHVPRLPNTGIAAVAVDPTDPAHYLVGTGADGVLASSDGGGSWTYEGSGLSRDRTVCDLVAAPGGAGLHAITVGTLWRSSDGGASWSPNTPETSPVGPYPFAFGVTADPTDPDVLYVATRADGVFKSGDGGSTWAAASTGLPAARVDAVAVDPTAPQTLYASTASGIYRSLDGGGSWGFRGSANALKLKVDPSLPSTLYLDGGTRVSTDGGLSTSIPPLFAPYAAPGVYLTEFFSSLATAPSLPTRLFVAFHATIYNGFFTDVDELDRSDDRLQSTTLVSHPLRPHALAIDPGNPALLYLGKSEGVSRSYDGGVSFEPLTAGLGGVGCTLAILGAGEPRYAGTMQDGGASPERGVYVLEEPACTSDGDCDDGSDCSTDACVANVCHYTALPDGTSCDTIAPACGEGGTCYSGGCYRHSPACDDDNACTHDVCLLPSNCSHDPIPGCVPCETAAECDDGDPCTDDVCESHPTGKSCTHSPMVCNDSDSCTTDVCVDGVCTLNPIPGLCDDGDACTIDSCSASSCHFTVDPGTCTDRRLRTASISLSRSATLNKLTFLSKSPALLVPAAGSAEDPSLGGLTIELFTTNHTQVIQIPAGVGKPGWAVSTKNGTTYRYQNPGAPSGPEVKSLQLRDRPQLKIAGRTHISIATGDFPALGIRVTMGSIRLCARFAGDAIRTNRPGKLTAKGTLLPLGDCTAANLD